MRFRVFWFRDECRTMHTTPQNFKPYCWVVAPAGKSTPAAAAALCAGGGCFNPVSGVLGIETC